MKTQPEEQNNNPREFPTWKEISPDPEIISAKMAIKKLKVKEYDMGIITPNALSVIDWKEKLEGSYDVVLTSVEELFRDKNGHSYLDIVAKAQKNGLDLVPAPLVPIIRLNYDKHGESVNIAIKPIIINTNPDVLTSPNSVINNDRSLIFECHHTYQDEPSTYFTPSDWKSEISVLDTRNADGDFGTVGYVGFTKNGSFFFIRK